MNHRNTMKLKQVLRGFPTYTIYEHELNTTRFNFEFALHRVKYANMSYVHDFKRPPYGRIRCSYDLHTTVYGLTRCQHEVYTNVILSIRMSYELYECHTTTIRLYKRAIRHPHGVFVWSRDHRCFLPLLQDLLPLWYRLTRCLHGGMILLPWMCNEPHFS